MAWEWLMWRCFGDIRETFEEKGWEYGYRDGYRDNEAMPLLATSGELSISFLKRDPGTGECWFELRDGARDKVLFVRGSHNIPAPGLAATLVTDYGVSADGVSALRDRPVYEQPVAPAMPVAQAS